MLKPRHDKIKLKSKFDRITVCIHKIHLFAHYDQEACTSILINERIARINSETRAPE